MVQIIDDPYNGNAFGRIGKGLGQGLSEQLPKEIERYRLSSGLRDLAKSNETNPVNQLADLHSIPGLSTDAANTILPYLRQQAALKESRKNSEMSSRKNQTQPEDSIEDFQLRGTPEAIRQGGSQLSYENPLQFPTIESGVAEYEKRIANQEKQILDVDTRFNNDLSQVLQNKETASQVLGDLQQQFKNKAYNDVLQGKLTSFQAGRKYSQEALNFAKARQNLNTVFGISKWATSPSTNRKNLEEVRKEYKKNDQLESFANELVANGLSQPYAHYIAFPPRENKQINNLLADTKRERRFNIFSNKQEKKLAKEISDIKLNPDDSILSIALQLKEKGLDPKSFVDEIRNLNNENKIALTPRQQSELQKVGNFSPTMADNYLLALWGLDNLERKI